MAAFGNSRREGEIGVSTTLSRQAKERWPRGRVVYQVDRDGRRAYRLERPGRGDVPLGIEHADAARALARLVAD